MWFVLESFFFWFISLYYISAELWHPLRYLYCNCFVMRSDCHCRYITITSKRKFRPPCFILMTCCSLISQERKKKKKEKRKSKSKKEKKKERKRSKKKGKKKRKNKRKKKKRRKKIKRKKNKRKKKREKRRKVKKRRTIKKFNQNGTELRQIELLK